MRVAGAGFISMLLNELTTIATLWEITREDTTTFFFTDHSEDIVHSGDTYTAADGFNASPLSNKSDFSVDSIDLQGVLNVSGISESDITSGLFDYADVVVKLINYVGDLNVDFMIVSTGKMGEVSTKRESFLAESRGLTERMQRNVGSLYSPICRVILGTTECAFSMAGNTVQGDAATSTPVSVTGVTSRQVFTISSLSAFGQNVLKDGEIEWLTGNNTGLKMEIKSSKSGVITLVLPMVNTIQTGDTATVLVGCDKRFQTCIDKFNNAVNFRGEPHVPGMDKLLATVFNNSGTTGVT